MNNYRTTLRISNNLKNIIQFLAIKNIVSFNKMVIYLLSLGIETYFNRYENKNDINEFNLRGVKKNEEQN